MKKLFKIIFNISDFSREERLVMYEKLRVYYSKRLEQNIQTNYGLCDSIAELFKTRVYYHLVFKRQFPELASQRPLDRKGHMYWFPCPPEGDKQRLEAIEMAIAELELKMGLPITN